MGTVMKKALLSALFAGLCVAGTCASADPLLKYNNLDIAYRNTNPDSGTDLNGLQLNASYSPIENLFLQLGYDYDAESNLDINTFEYGGGGWYELMPDLHLVGLIGGKHERFSFDEFGSTSIDIFYIGPQLRYKVIDPLELDGGYIWESGEGETSNNFNVGLLLGFTDNLAARIAVEFLDGEDATRYTAGLRFVF